MTAFAAGTTGNWGVRGREGHGALPWVLTEVPPLSRSLSCVSHLGTGASGALRFMCQWEAFGQCGQMGPSVRNAHSTNVTPRCQAQLTPPVGGICAMSRLSAVSAGRTPLPRGKSSRLLADLQLIRCGPPRVESNLLYSVYECECSSHLKNTSQQHLDQRLTRSLATVA